MSGSDETRTITGWRQATRYYRRNPGLGWLLALLAIPLLLGLLGWGVLDTSKKDVDLTMPTVSATATLPSVTTPNVNLPSLSWGALSLLRNGNDVTLTGVLSTEAAKTSLLDSVRGLFGANVNVIDNLTVKDGVSIPDLSGIGTALKPDVDIPDFGWKVDGDTITLTGTVGRREGGCRGGRKGCVAGCQDRQPDSGLVGKPGGAGSAFWLRDSAGGYHRSAADPDQLLHRRFHVGGKFNGTAESGG